MFTDMIHTVMFAAIFQGLLLLAGGIFLGMALPENNILAQTLRHITGPVMKTVAVITPTVLPVWLHGVLAIIWLLVLRVGFYLVMGAYGLLPAVTS
jgi:type IV secretory pathway VirB2 component (pilin)